MANPYVKPAVEFVVGLIKGLFTWRKEERDAEAVPRGTTHKALEHQRAQERSAISHRVEPPRVVTARPPPLPEPDLQIPISITPPSIAPVAVDQPPSPGPPRPPRRRKSGTLPK